MNTKKRLKNIYIYIYIYFNASIYNVLSLAIYFNKFAFCLLNNITDLFKSYQKCIDKLKNISLRAIEKRGREMRDSLQSTLTENMREREREFSL